MCVMRLSALVSMCVCGGGRGVGVEHIHHTADNNLCSQQLGDYISDIASNMMLVEEHLLWMAQNEARACTRIVQCVERIADLALSGNNRAISKVQHGFMF